MYGNDVYRTICTEHNYVIAVQNNLYYTFAYGIIHLARYPRRPPSPSSPAGTLPFAESNTFTTKRPPRSATFRTREEGEGERAPRTPCRAPHWR